MPPFWKKDVIKRHKGTYLSPSIPALASYSRLLRSLRGRKGRLVLWHKQSHQTSLMEVASLYGLNFLKEVITRY